ncbi:hypothetical protein [Fictibacillus enclensis]|uniref:hypothetical protein n=1 Tax=Fictibacillus enclensis TaxID=1017270 RepID=UPI0024BF961F|nr:hypothetical protein [Fictibacillus enclensis]WHY71990.1 hypothetical protein QNH15_23855 [Fictibacillus enclensis]
MKVLKTKASFHININTILLTLLFFFMHNCFYLVDSSHKILGIIGYQDFLFLYCFLICIYYYTRYPKNYFQGTFAKVILFVPIIVILSSFMAYAYYGQSLISGILTQRAWLITMFLYFPFMALIRNGKLNFESFLSIMYKVVFFELILYFIQYFVGESMMFLKVIYNYRYGTLRLYCDTAYMTLLATFATVKFMNKEKIIKNAFFITAVISYVFIVNKGRSACMILLLTIALVILLSKSNIIYKIVIMVLASFLGLYVFLSTETVQEFIAIIFQSADDVTYNVRLQSQQYYLSKLNSTNGAWVFGFGYPNSTNPNSMAATGVYLGYLLADNGIYGFLFCYGLLGAIWYLYSLLVQIKSSIRLLYKKSKDSAMIVTVVIGLASIVTNVQFFYSFYSFYSVLVFIAIELLFKKYEVIYKVKNNELF